MSATLGLTDEPLPRRHRITVSEYYRMAEIGILGEDDRVELIEGEIIDMVPIGSDHAGTVNRLTYMLVQLFGASAIVSVQQPLRLDEYSEPQPDFTVLRPRDDFYRTAHPTAADVLLLIEVAKSSLAYDREVKLPLYARHGVPEVWIVNLAGHVLEARRDPVAGAYARSAEYGPADTIAPAAAADLRIDLARILA